MSPVRVDLSQEEASLCVAWHIQTSVAPEGLELVLGLEGQRVDSSAKSLLCTGPPGGQLPVLVNLRQMPLQCR